MAALRIRDSPQHVLLRPSYARTGHSHILRRRPLSPHAAPASSKATDDRRASTSGGMIAENLKRASRKIVLAGNSGWRACGSGLRAGAATCRQELSEKGKRSRVWRRASDFPQSFCLAVGSENRVPNEKEGDMLQFFSGMRGIRECNLSFSQFKGMAVSDSPDAPPPNCSISPSFSLNRAMSLIVWAPISGKRGMPRGGVAGGGRSWHGRGANPFPGRRSWDEFFVTLAECYDVSLLRPREES